MDEQENPNGVCISICEDEEDDSFDENNEVVIEEHIEDNDILADDDDDDDDDGDDDDYHQSDDDHMQSPVLTLDITGNENSRDTSHLQNSQDLISICSINPSPDNEVNSEIGGEHFMLNSVDELKEILEDYYERTSTRFVGWRKTKHFGLPSSECRLSGHQVQWCDTVRNTNNGLDNLVPFDGIPYMIVGHYDMDCQFGNDRNASGKAKRKQKKAEGIINTRTHNFTQPTKRCGCPAKISVKQIIRFPEFKIDTDSKWKKNNRSTRLKAKLKECREDVKMEVCIVGKLPEISEHKHHKSIKGTETVLQELIILAQEMYLQDRTYSQIQQSLRQFVIEDLFWNKEPPDASRRKYYPTLRDIRYFCNRALQLLRFTDEEQEHIRKVISDIQSRGDVNVSFILTEGNVNKDDDPDSLQDDSEKLEVLKNLNKKNDEKKIQTFLLCNQTDSQHRLLKRYSNVAYLIEIENNIPLKNNLTYRMYAIIIQTNIDYQVAGCITVSKQKKNGLIDGLRLFREWNPTWNPRYFMVDCSPSIYEAVSAEFPESQYFLNPHSCEKKWFEFFNKPSNNLQEYSEEIMNYLKTMQYSLTEDSLSIAAAFLEASDIWQSRDNLREWFQNSWLPLAKQWVFGYRPEDLMILQHLKASIDDCIHVYKAAFGRSSKFNGFMEMVENISSSIPYKEYEKYIERNKEAYMFYNHYSKTKQLPEYLKNVPISLLPYLEGVCKLAESTNFLINRDNLDAFTVQFDATNNIAGDNTNRTLIENDGKLIENEKQKVFAITEEGDSEERKEIGVSETDFGWIEYSKKMVPGENMISFGDSYSHPFCTCSHWLLYRLPCVHIISVFSKVPGWRYDMLSPLYRASPLIEIDCSSINFSIEDQTYSDTYDKECQTSNFPVTTASQTASQTDMVKHPLDEDLFEVPSNIWDYIIVLTQSKDFLKHLNKMAFLFKDKNMHQKFRLQLEKTISKLEIDSLKNKGQKIEFTAKGVVPPKPLREDHNSLKISSLNLENIKMVDEPLKVINVTTDSKGSENVKEATFPVVGVGGKVNCDSITTKSISNINTSKTVLFSIKNTSLDVPPHSDALSTMTEVTTTGKTKIVNSTFESVGLNSVITSPNEEVLLPNNIDSSIIDINSNPHSSYASLLPEDVKTNIESGIRKRKFIDFELDARTSNSFKDHIDVVKITIADKNPIPPYISDIPDEKNKKQLLSVLNYLPLLNKTISPQQVVSATRNKRNSKIDLLKNLPPNVGLTRCSIKAVSPPFIEQQSTDTMQKYTSAFELHNGPSSGSSPIEVFTKVRSSRSTEDTGTLQKFSIIEFKEKKPD